MDGETHTRVDVRVSSFSADSLKIKGIIDAIKGLLQVAEYSANVELVNSDEILAINSKFRNSPNSTDVLSFPQNEWTVLPLVGKSVGETSVDNYHFPEKTLGDIIISPSNAAENAHKIGHTIDRELCFLLVHGTLHLCGHDHRNHVDEKIMVHQQKVIMTHLSESPLGPLWLDCIRKKG